MLAALWIGPPLIVRNIFTLAALVVSRPLTSEACRVARCGAWVVDDGATRALLIVCVMLVMFGSAPEQRRTWIHTQTCCACCKSVVRRETRSALSPEPTPRCYPVDTPGQDSR